MKLRTAKHICYAVHYERGKRLNWSQDTIFRMERYRAKHNAKQRRKIEKRRANMSLAK